MNILVEVSSTNLIVVTKSETELECLNDDIVAKFCCFVNIYNWC